MNEQRLIEGDVELMAHEPEHLRAMIASADEYERGFGLRAADGLRDFMVSPEVSPAWLEQLRAAVKHDPWTHGFAVVHAAEEMVIGLASFKGPPTADGAVEIAYGIVPRFQSRGFATEAARLLLRFAAAHPDVRTVLAHTAPQANASTRVLEKCGFHYVGEVDDPEDGRVWRWQRPCKA